MSFSHPWETAESYVLLWNGGVQLLPNTLRPQGPSRSEPNLTFDKPPGAPAGNEFARGDGQRMLLPVVFKGPMTFETEAERMLYVAAMDEAAGLATQMERQETSGPLGRAPGHAQWTPGGSATLGELTVTVYPTARPQINGREVDWS